MVTLRVEDDHWQQTIVLPDHDVAPNKYFILKRSSNEDVYLSFKTMMGDWALLDVNDDYNYVIAQKRPIGWSVTAYFNSVPNEDDTWSIHEGLRANKIFGSGAQRIYLEMANDRWQDSLSIPASALPYKEIYLKNAATNPVKITLEKSGKSTTASAQTEEMYNKEDSVSYHMGQFSPTFFSASYDPETYILFDECTGLMELDTLLRDNQC